VFILVIPLRVDKSYLQSGDGSSQISATIDAPDNNYVYDAAYALVNGKLHIFGGAYDKTKVMFFVKNTFLSAISNDNKIVNRKYKSKKSKNKLLIFEKIFEIWISVLKNSKKVLKESEGEEHSRGFRVP